MPFCLARESRRGTGATNSGVVDRLKRLLFIDMPKRVSSLSANLSCFEKQLCKEPYWKTNHVQIRAGYRCHRRERLILYTVRTGLIHRGAAEYVLIDLSRFEFPHAYRSGVDLPLDRATNRNRDAGMDKVLPTGKPVEHGHRVCGVCWLAERNAVQFNHRIGRNDAGCRVIPCDCRCFAPGQFDCQVNGCERGQRVLVYVRRDHRKLETD